MLFSDHFWNLFWKKFIFLKLCVSLTRSPVLLQDDFKKDWKVEKGDRLSFSPGTYLIVEKRYNIATENI